MRPRARVARRYLDHPPLTGLVAEKEACARAELTEPPSRVNMVQHRDHQSALEIGAGR
jgi:hypothetical protein